MTHQVGTLGTFYPHGLEATKVPAKVKNVWTDENGDTWYTVTVETDQYSFAYPWINQGEEYIVHDASFTTED